MSTDPYHAVQQEIQTSLQTAAQLHASYIRIRSTAREDSEELGWARSELKATLAALEADLEDLEESVKIVESTDARMFGLDDAEVQRRRRYVGDVRKEIQNLRAEVSATSSRQIQSPVVRSPPPRSGLTSPHPERSGGEGEDDHQAAWAREEQQLIMQEQDQAMDSIVGTLSNLAQQAGLMGQEIVEHNELLDDLEQGVDQTDSKLNDAMLKMRKFLRQSEERGSGWCIVILIIILMVLLIAVILF
ncbi:snare protein TLG1/Syntaxin [Collybia nuda]|uniref:Snare protein TLG1/Syntaxin n=1 Tax=Collybia nuda TaxID=64659 RepID=A0A9P5YHB1_9AGAR|nr:snare protein TLG1/Syntaxin [Collybia nuda]